MAGGADGLSTARLPDGTTPGVTTETAPLRAVMLHRPGDEIQRVTPRDTDRLLTGSARLECIQQAHDSLADVLRNRDVAVYLLGELLVETIAVSGAARIQGIAAAVRPRRLGVQLAGELSAYLRGLPAAGLAEILIAGMTFDELPRHDARSVPLDGTSLVRQMHHGDDFAIDPLPNLLFARDSSFWIGQRFAIASLASVARERESSLTDLIYAHHPMFSGTRRAYGSQVVPVEGGDVLLLSAGVAVVGVSERTTPAGAESLARSLFDDDLAHTVLAVPIDRRVAHTRLDTLVTMVDTDTLLVGRSAAMSLVAYTIRSRDDGGVRVETPRPFQQAAAEAVGTTEMRLIQSRPGSDDVESNVEVGNLLSVAPGVVIAYDESVETNRRLVDAGIEVLEIDGSKLVSVRGGPRGLVCPLIRQF
ncbi:arginine deiminase family protein [Gordonia sp. CPCC 205333]|uniref:arginine deiminase family protein n=1 Tax=Gordonia sp. CPCC 205333 TaxID=3140790 RepID=UPI003AF3C26E